MGLIRSIRRITYVWGWRARYWMLDTASGQRVRLVVYAGAALVTVIQMLRMLVEATVPAPPDEPAKAMFPWVVQIIIAIAAAAISYAMRPKPQKPTPQAAEAPTINDGLAAKHHFGTCWVSDEFLLAWKNTGTIKIKSKSGKK